MEFRSIVAGVDFSPSSVEALRTLRLLASEGAKVLLVHATEVRPFDLVNAAAAGILLSISRQGEVARVDDVTPAAPVAEPEAT